MNNYVFIISERGARTNICSTMELISLEKLIKILKKDYDFKQKYINKEIEYSEYRKNSQLLDSWWKSLRIGKIDDSSFQTRISKYITLEEFEDIFKENIEDIKPLLEYSEHGEKYFKKEILKKYGIKVDER